MKINMMLAVMAVYTLCPLALEAEPAWALNGRNLLVRFDTNTPGFTDETKLIRGLQPGYRDEEDGERID